MKTGIVIQARMSSTRLPGKVLLELPGGSGQSVLARCVSRLRGCRRADEILVATTSALEDDAIVAEAVRLGVPVFRGSRDDVLARYHGAAVSRGYDRVVRITSDCPCIDPEVVDRVIEALGRENCDYGSNVFPRTFPHGLDTEVITFDALDRAHREALDKAEREHVTYFVNTTRRDLFSSTSVVAEAGEVGPKIRVTLDTHDDYSLLWAVFDLLGPDRLFTCRDLVALFSEKPWLHRINSTVRQKGVFSSEAAEIDEAVEILRLQGLDRAAMAMEARRLALSSGGGRS